MAISQIRRSAGKLYGLPLAVFDALVFPLLLLDGLIMTVVSAVTMPAGWDRYGAAHLPGDLPISDALPALLVLSISLPIIAWVDYRIVQLVWHKVTGYEPPPKPPWRQIHGPRAATGNARGRGPGQDRSGWNWGSPFLPRRRRCRCSAWLAHGDRVERAGNLAC